MEEWFECKLPSPQAQLLPLHHTPSLFTIYIHVSRGSHWMKVLLQHSYTDWSTQQCKHVSTLLKNNQLVFFFLLLVFFPSTAACYFIFPLIWMCVNLGIFTKICSTWLLNLLACFPHPRESLPPSNSFLLPFFFHGEALLNFSLSSSKHCYCSSASLHCRLNDRKCVFPAK